MLDQPDFLKKFGEMQRKTIEVTRTIGKQLRPGMSEAEVAGLYAAALADAGLKDHWYPILVYAGESTALPISRKSHLPSHSVQIQENDIVMLDSTPLDGTVWSNWAETFVVGHDEFYEALIADAHVIVNKVYDFTASQAKTVGDIYKYAMQLIESGGFTSLDPLGDVGHSIFQVPEGQTVDKTPPEDRLFIYPEHGDRQLEGIISVEPQIGKKHPVSGKMYSAKLQKVFIVPV